MIRYFLVKEERRHTAGVCLAQLLLDTELTR